MRGRILLVDDDPDDLALTVSVLSEHVEAEIRIAEDGVEALEYLARAGRDAETEPALPHLVLLGLRQSRADRLEVLRQIRRRPATRRVPVVVLSSSAEEEHLARSYELGANSYVQRPADFDEFSRLARTLAEYWLGVNRVVPRREPVP